MTFKIKSEHGVYVAVVALAVSGFNIWQNHETATAQNRQQLVQDAEFVSVAQRVTYPTFTVPGQTAALYTQIIIENSGQQPINELELLYSTEPLAGHIDNFSYSLVVPLDSCVQYIYNIFSTSVTNVRIQYLDKDGLLWQQGPGGGTPIQIQALAPVPPRPDPPNTSQSACSGG